MSIHPVTCYSSELNPVSDLLYNGWLTAELRPDVLSQRRGRLVEQNVDTKIFVGQSSKSRLQLHCIQDNPITPYMLCHMLQHSSKSMYKYQHLPGCSCFGISTTAEESGEEKKANILEYDTGHVSTGCKVKHKVDNIRETTFP